MADDKKVRFMIHQDVAEHAAQKSTEHSITNQAKVANDRPSSKEPKRNVLGTVTNIKQNRGMSHVLNTKAFTFLRRYDQCFTRSSDLFCKKINVTGNGGFTTDAKENLPCIDMKPKGKGDEPLLTNQENDCNMQSPPSGNSTPEIVGSPMSTDESFEPEPSGFKVSESSLYGRILYVSEYSTEILQHLKWKEVYFMPPVNHMAKQPEITMAMRCILVDWLVEVAGEYNLHRETLCLSVNYVDRFLSQMSVVRPKLQLLGAAAMFIASKYEEIYPPDVQEFVFITDDTYTKKQLRKMEKLILKVLHFDLAVPTMHIFLEWFLGKINQTDDDDMYHLAMYIMELVLVHGEVLSQFPPSKIAAAALYLAEMALGCNVWNPAMKLVSGYGMQELEECVKCVYIMYRAAPHMKQQAVQDKYKLEEFREVAYVPMLELNLKLA